MIESEFKTYGIFALILSRLLSAAICFFIYTLISVIFLGGHIIPRGTLPPFGAIIYIIVLVFFLITIINSWIHYVFKIKIDSDERIIFFKNIITRKTTSYGFSDFDCYFDTFAKTGKGGSYKVVYLVKNNKAEKIMSGFYYSNIDELQDAVSSIKYIGFKKDFSKIARRAILNKPIIDNKKV